MCQDFPGTSFWEGTKASAAQELVTARHAGGTGLALEMPHQEKLMAELGQLSWGCGLGGD